MRWLLLFLIPFTLYGSEVKLPWLTYYANEAPIEQFAPYNPIVLDSENHPPLEPLLAQKKELLGYIDLGEAEEWRSWFSYAKSHGLLVKENKDWPGSWIIDLRNPAWKNLLLDEVLPAILAKGFTGLFFDELDVSIALEQEDPVKYKGMTQAAAELVLAIHKRFPDKQLMMNRAYQIIHLVGHAIDYELAEDLYTTYDFEKKTYSMLSQEDVDWQMKFLNEGRRQFPHLVLFNLDYWYPDDTETIKKLYERSRRQCFRPYVSTIGLDKIIPEP